MTVTGRGDNPNYRVSIVSCCFSAKSMAWKYPLLVLASLVAAEDYTLHESPGLEECRFVQRRWYLKMGRAPENEDGKMKMILLKRKLIF